ncbi:MAG: fumarate hydratase [Oscillospiraceae bacterium]|nr:fumarate hydratase [Oscillospiraceae bacterium]
MRTIDVKAIENAIAVLCVEANLTLPESLRQSLRNALANERTNIAKDILQTLLENITAAEAMRIPICQDTGMVVVFAEIGQDVHFVGGLFEEAVHRGVARGYTEGYLRCSIAADPLRRENTGDNTPAVLHLSIVDGDGVRLRVCPKGFGSENMSRLKMLTPAADENDLIAFVSETVQLAGSNPCPPMVLGVGIGGNFESCALLAKKALCRCVGEANSDPFYAELEQKMLSAVNASNIGPQGFGGDTTALWLAIEAAPTHIAGLPVAVNVGCHVTRHAEQMI